MSPPSRNWSEKLDILNFVVGSNHRSIPCAIVKFLDSSCLYNICIRPSGGLENI